MPPFQSESKRETILMKMTDLHENETAYKTQFLMKGFALRLVLIQRRKRTQKWPIWRERQTASALGLELFYNSTTLSVRHSSPHKFNRPKNYVCYKI